MLYYLLSEALVVPHKDDGCEVNEYKQRHDEFSLANPTSYEPQQRRSNDVTERTNPPSIHLFWRVTIPTAGNNDTKNNSSSSFFPLMEKILTMASITTKTHNVKEVFFFIGSARRQSKLTTGSIL